MIPVTKTSLPDLDSYVAYLEEIWRSGQLTNNGPLVKQLSASLQQYLQVPRIQLVANGTLALQLAIKALNVSGEVITTPFSYVATSTAIVWEGCSPVFVDINKKSLCINPDLIEAAITERTSAILATHVFGYPCDVEKIENIARRHNLKVIYDAAHAFSVRLNGQSLMCWGDASTLSFHATKLFHTAEGGAVVCREESIANRLFLMSKFGHMGEDEYLELGINAKLSELHAAMGLTVLPKVAEIIEQRKQCSQWYDEYLEGCGLQRPAMVTGLEYNYAYYPVIFSTHETMMRARQALFDNGIGPRRYFHPSLNTLPYLRAEAQKPCPVSERVSDRVLCLPLFAGLEQRDVADICNITRAAIA